MARMTCLKGKQLLCRLCNKEMQTHRWMLQDTAFKTDCYHDGRVHGTALSLPAHTKHVQSLTSRITLQRNTADTQAIDTHTKAT